MEEDNRCEPTTKVRLGFSGGAGSPASRAAASTPARVPAMAACAYEATPPAAAALRSIRINVIVGPGTEWLSMAAAVVPLHASGPAACKEHTVDLDSNGIMSLGSTGN